MELKSVSNIARVKDIVIVLMKYGFGEVVQHLDLPVKTLAQKISPVSDPGIDNYKRIRMAIEELGPTFIKLGQILSMQPDLLPAPLINELGKLRDAVTPVAIDEIKPVLENEFDAPIARLFHSFDTEPVASASLSQVHKAVHPDGKTILAVKIRRPGIVKTVKTDLDILDIIALQAHKNIENLRLYDLPTIVKSNRRTLLREIDFSREANYIRIARSKNQSDAVIVIPDVFPDYSTPRVLVTEYIKGVKIAPDLQLPLQKRKALARAGVRSSILQILQHGFYHADPHPGNMLITPDNNLCLMDWGMVGQLTTDEKNDLLFMIQSTVNKDTRKLTDMLLHITTAQGTVDRRQLEKDLIDIIDTYLSQSLKDIMISQFLTDIVNVLQSHQLRLPPDISIMIKALITVEGTARMLYPDLDVVSEARPHIKKLVSRQYSINYVWNRFRDNLMDIWSFQRSLPSRLSTIVKKIEQGKLTIRFEHRNLKDFKNSMESSFNRLTLGIIISAMIMGSSMIITTGVRPWIFGFPALGIIGYLISALLGIWLIITIIRRRNF